MRAGQAQAWPDVPFHGDVLHPLLEGGRLLSYLKDRAEGATTAREELDRQMERAKRSCKGQKVSPAAFRTIYELEGLPDADPSKWQRESEVRRELRSAFSPIQLAVRGLADTVRASSLVENINSRLRPWVLLWKTPNQPHLHLLRFSFHHRRFMRSERAERVGRSPAEILTGQDQPHWLEQLGFQRFRRSA